MEKAKPVTMALLGAGARGELNLGTLARRHPAELRIVAVAEPHDGRREQFVKTFGIARENAFRDWQELTARPQLADALINALPCRIHHVSTLSALRAGYDVLLEKPMALFPGECAALAEAGEKLGRILQVSLQCRYNPIYQRLRRMLESNRLGRLMNIDCAENMGYWHFIMSYVRGMHHHSSLSHSTLMAKAIHDLDLIVWLAGVRPVRVASFGSLKFFTRENAPAGAPERCLDGCPVEASCEFSAIKQYLKPGQPDIPYRLFSGMSWSAARDFLFDPRLRSLGSVIAPEDPSPAGRRAALAETDHGRCVFRCDNDVVDHQTVSVEFENGVVASFSLSAFSLIWERTLHLHGTEGEVRSADFSGRLELRTYHPGRVRSERIRYHGIFHGGADETILLEFARAARGPHRDAVLTSARNCLESHLLCFAAEEARRSGRVVEMEEFRSRIRR